MQPAYIDSVYQTKFGELWDQDWSDLALDAVKGSLQQSKLKLAEIEAIFLGSMLHSWVLGQNNLSGWVSQLLDVHIPIIPVEVACASGGVAFYQAARSVQSGQYQKVLALGVEKMTDLDSELIAEALMGAASIEEREAGLTFPGLYALMTRAYLNQYGKEADELAAIPVASHQWAHQNSLAHFPILVTPEQVNQSSLVADPLRLLHCSGVSDGAAAVVITNQKSEVEVAGLGMATDSLSLVSRESTTALKATQLAAKQAYAEAEVRPQDIDLAEVHDCFSIAQLMAVEDLGLAIPGQGLAVASGKNIPINTSGGLKACGHPVGATGIKQIVELTTQLKGLAGERQVPEAQVGVAQNVAGSGSVAVVSILQATSN